MKKIFTFLLLAALVAIPQSVQAIYWRTATGNELRINPENPADPNDLIPIPAGTRYFQIFGSRADANSKCPGTDFLILVLNEGTYFIDQQYDKVGDQMHVLDHAGRPGGFSSYSKIHHNYGSGFKPTNFTFPDMILTCRVARNFGYTYYLDVLQERFNKLQVNPKS